MNKATDKVALTAKQGAKSFTNQFSGTGGYGGRYYVADVNR